jgi:aspartate-semialdehyde dehydrogenase
MAPRPRVDVGVLGATGMVGQQFVARLAAHPWFRVVWLAASERSEGKVYADAAPWRLAMPMPESVRGIAIDACAPGRGPRVVFSALDAAAADQLEGDFAAAGHIVLSNARSHRMDPLVPLLVPEINADHLALVPEQQRERRWTGAIVTNPNCAVAVLATTLAPLRQFGLTTVQVTTLQAVSGAGYPGVPSLDILGNVIPYIGGGEEDKIERETVKVLGAAGGRAIHPAVVSAQVTRVPVIDGHAMTVSVALDHGPSADAVVDALRTFRGRPQAERLPSAPDPPVVVHADPHRPQPRLDVDLGGGMTVSVGRLRPCPVASFKYFALGHNTVRGAAGGSILNAELMHVDGLL